jgi:hypothetical protein
MAKYISNEVARLIRQRAYAKGALSSLDKEESKSLADFVQLRQALLKLRQKKKKAIAHIAKLDAEITKLLPVDPDDIRGIRHTPHSGAKHGAIVRTIVRVLKNSSGPIQTPDIILIVVAELGWDFDTPDAREVARRRVIKPLQVMAKKGVVTRLHDATENKVGAWKWVGI